MKPELVLSSTGAGRSGQRLPKYHPDTGTGHNDTVTQLEQDFGWKRELFAPESSWERRDRIEREFWRSNTNTEAPAGLRIIHEGKGNAMMWAEKWKYELRGTLPSFGRKLH